MPRYDILAGCLILVWGATLVACAEPIDENKSFIQREAEREVGSSKAHARVCVEGVEWWTVDRSNYHPVWRRDGTLKPCGENANQPIPTSRP
jgi:hypothetical protein